MKLDATELRYVLPDEFRVLQAVETGSKNHEVVPTQLIAQLSKITGGNVNKCLGSLAKRGLVSRVQGAKYDGYRLTYGGLDWLALKAFSKRGTVTSVGQRIGVGKEGDISIIKGKGTNAWNEDELEEQEIQTTGEEETRILKIHRLGRISFRAIKTKRDYLGTRKSASWMYMSRLAARKEWEFMKVLYEYGFPVPEPFDQGRHCIVMSLVEGFPLRQISELPSHVTPALLQAKLMQLIVRLARVGLIHGDFNEFNVMIKDKSFEPVVIDFPQMVSVGHENAEYFFNRDVECVRRFFRRRFRYESDECPDFRQTMADLADELAGRAEPESGLDPELDDDEVFERSDKTILARRGKIRLDELVEASGFARNMWQDLEQYMNDVSAEPGENDVSSEGESEDDDEDEGQERLSRKLKAKMSIVDGDEAPELHDNDEDDSEEDDDDDSEEESSSDEESIIAPSTTATHKRNLRDTKALQNIVAGDIARARSSAEKQHHSKKALHSAGKAKGSKWKSSPSIMVGKSGDKSGWS